MNDDDPHAPALDDEDIALIAGALGPLPLDGAAQARVRRRLLQRIAADSTPRHVTVQPGDGSWQPWGAGVSMKILHEAGGVMSYLVRLAPGAALLAHRHPIDEECVVLEGEVAIGDLRVAAGGFHLGRAGVLHDSVRSDGGAVIFLRGAPPEIETIL